MLHLSFGSVFQCDRMAADMAIELKKKGVVSVSLWPGAVQTELISQYTSQDEAPPGFDPKVSNFYLSQILISIVYVKWV